MSFRFMRQVDLTKPLLMACLLAAPIAAQAGSYRMLHAFQSGTDGALPEGKLTPEGDALYGAPYVVANATAAPCIELKKMAPRRLSTLLPAAPAMALTPKVAWPF